MIEVWGRVNSLNVQKVMWAVGELGLDHVRIDAGGAFGKLNSPEFRALNPNGLVPVVRDGSTVVWESNACVRYLAAAHGRGSLWPEDPAGRAEADRWMDWQLGPVLAQVRSLFVGLVRTPEGQRDAAALARAAEAAGPAWQILDDHLGGRPFVAGDELTMGDIPLGCLFWRYLNLQVERPNLPNLHLWHGRLKERDAYRQHVMVPLS